MKCWLDILTPKQVMFSTKLIPRLEEAGFEVVKTSRRYRELDEMLELKKIETLVVGKHGGKTLEGKLGASLQRALALSKLVREMKPDLALSFTSVEAARVAFGLKISFSCITDTSHAEAQNRLTVPFCRLLFTPWVIPKREWIGFGIASESVIPYRAIDPIVWLREFKPDAAILDELGLDKSKPLIVCRTEEAFAAYLLGLVSDERPVILSIIKSILDQTKDVQIVAIPRYGKQASALRRAFKGRVKVPKGVVDASNLLAHTTVFVGAGGTMSAEAALLGVPTISCYPGEPFWVEKYLVKQGMVYRIKDAEEASKKVLDILDHQEHYGNLHGKIAQEVKSKMEDPLEVIVSNLKRL